MKPQQNKASHRRIDLNISAKTKEKAEIVKHYIGISHLLLYVWDVILLFLYRRKVR